MQEIRIQGCVHHAALGEKVNAVAQRGQALAGRYLNPR
jgi:hypothetical protein